LVAAIEDELGRRVAIPPHPQVTVAYGAALIGLDSYRYELEQPEEMPERPAHAACDCSGSCG